MGEMDFSPELFACHFCMELKKNPFRVVKKVGMLC